VITALGVPLRCEGVHRSDQGAAVNTCKLLHHCDGLLFTASTAQDVAAMQQSNHTWDGMTIAVLHVRSARGSSTHDLD